MEESSFIWHRVSEEEKTRIREKAKEIMDNFGKALEKVGESGSFFIRREEFLRDEGTDKNNISRDIVFENAPRKNSNSIIAEKGSWV